VKLVGSWKLESGIDKGDVGGKKKKKKIPGLEEFSYNPLHGKQIDYSHVYFKKSYNSLKMSCD
jgi:hypothetical protein